MPDAHANFAYSTVATAPSPATSGTSLVVAAGDGAKFPTVPFNATVWPTSVNALSTNAEIVRVTAISTDTLTITRATESTSARTVVVGDQIAATITNKTLNEAEQGVESFARGTTGSLASTWDRALTNITTNSAILSSGRANLTRILLPKGLPITNISWWSANTAVVSATNQWFFLCDSARLKLAITADDGATAWATSTQKTLAITGGPFVTTYAGWYYLGINVTATTVPTLLTLSGLNGTTLTGAAPITSGNTMSTGLTNPASCPSTLGAITVQTFIPYAEVS